MQLCADGSRFGGSGPGLENGKSKAEGAGRARGKVRWVKLPWPNRKVR